MVDRYLDKAKQKYQNERVLRLKDVEGRTDITRGAHGAAWSREVG